MSRLQGEVSRFFAFAKEKGLRPRFGKGKDLASSGPFGADHQGMGFAILGDGDGFRFRIQGERGAHTRDQKGGEQEQNQGNGFAFFRRGGGLNLFHQGKFSLAGNKNP